MPVAKPVDLRFWRFVERGADDACWEWKGCRNRRGYGWLCVRRDNRWGLAPAHRVSWQIHNGPIPEGMWVLHSCDNPPCVNPAHLSLGTVADNNRQTVERGRRVDVYG